MSRIRIALVAVLALLVAVAPAAARPSKIATPVVTVKMKEFRFILSKSRVPHGKVTFKLVNIGKLAHDFRIAGKTSKLIQPGKTGTFVVTLTKGKHTYNCPVPGHTKAGMKGVLTVT
jgi:uncharacterized cupredoxin-like copper-binding protein